MSRTIMLIPTGTSVGLTSVSLGVVRSMEQKGVQLSVFKPIAQPRVSGNKDQTTEVLRSHSSITTIVEPLTMEYVESLLTSSKKDILMEEIVARYHEHTKDAEVILIEGLVPTRKHSFAQSLNYEIAKTLGAEIVFVTAPGNSSIQQMQERLELVRNEFGGQRNENIIGVIVNKVNAPVDDQGRTRPDLSEIFDDSTKATVANIDAKALECLNLPVLATIPWNFDLIATRAIDMAKHLNAQVVNEGEINTRRVKSVTFCARSIPHMLEHFRPGSLLVTSADRPDVLVSASLAAMNGVEIGAILLTGGYDIDAPIRKLCEQAFETGLPVFMVNSNTWQTSLNLQSFSLEVPADDHERIEKIQNYVARHISSNWIESLVADSERPNRLSPPAFRYQLTELARKAGKRIVLPEGDEPRTVKAASICAERGIATCVLLGNPDDIRRVAASQGIELGAGIEIVDPIKVREEYVARLVELRKSKGMTEVVAREQLEDNVVLGTLMLEKGEVDGLVSGAVHTTANTIRPPLQLIKTAPGSSLVSSVFFMLLPEQVFVYGDCAINPDPTAEQLSEIAIQSADSAKAFGIEPRVAMISYSTGNSGAGSDVEKVREATRLAQEKRPDLMIDGPLQYDAAVMADVAKSKAPNSPVAGKALYSSSLT
ncbi:Phosphate acetyltransferase [Providencia alcalifaciens]|nr:Phosphate acetyltransferase [Providencia alcalifaciens]